MPKVIRCMSRALYQVTANDKIELKWTIRQRLELGSIDKLAPASFLCRSPCILVVILNVSRGSRWLCVKAARKTCQPKAVPTNQGHGLAHNSTGIKIQGLFSIKVFPTGQTSFPL